MTPVRRSHGHCLCIPVNKAFLTVALSQNSPARSSNSLRLMLLWKSLPPCSSSTEMGAAVLADRISLVRRTWRRSFARDLGEVLQCQKDPPSIAATVIFCCQQFG
jgi:hypothetical protein